MVNEEFDRSELWTDVTFIGIPWQFANGTISRLKFDSFKLQIIFVFIAIGPVVWQTVESPYVLAWGQNISVIYWSKIG